MKTRTKKITSLLLMLLGLSPLLLVLTFHLRKEEIRSKMRERLESSLELHTVTIPADKVVWADDHEIWHNEKMFDIKSKKLENGVYTFTGLYDDEETELANAKQTADKKNNEEQKLLTTYFHWVWNSFQEKNFNPCINSIVLTEHFILNETLVNQLYSKVPTPPPRSILVQFFI